MSQFGASQKSYQKPWGEVDQIGEGWYWEEGHIR